MTNREQLIHLYDQQMRIDLRLPEVTYDITPRVVRDISLVENSGFVDYSNLNESNADAEIESQIADFKARKMPFFWKVYEHDQPSDLKERLKNHGFIMGKPSALMVLDLETAPEYFRTLKVPEHIQLVQDKAGIGAMIKVEEEVYSAPRDWLRERLEHMLVTTPERMSLFAAKVEGKVVSAAWTFYYPPSQFANLLGGATLPDYRKRGLYTALLVTRAREALRRGIRYLSVDASPMSQPILAKHGFEFLGQTMLCRWEPATQLE